MSIMIWGHRGHRRHRFADKYEHGVAYENSLQAYREALESCMGLECDVIQSREATVFLAHDTLFDGIVHYELKGHLQPADREVVGNRYIYQMSNQDISRLELKDGQEIPQLRTLLQLAKNYPGRYLNLELKGPNTADIAVRTVERAIQEGYIQPEQIIFSSFNLPALRDLRHKTGDRYKIGALFALKDQNISPMFPSWPNAPQDASYIPFKLEENVLDRDDVRDIDPDFFNLERGSISEEAVEQIAVKYPKAKVILWTAGEPHPSDNTLLIDTVIQFADNGKLFAVISDFPDEVQDALIARGTALKIAV